MSGLLNMGSRYLHSSITAASCNTSFRQLTLRNAGDKAAQMLQQLWHRSDSAEAVLHSRLSPSLAAMLMVGHPHPATLQGQPGVHHLADKSQLGIPLIQALLKRLLVWAEAHALRHHCRQDTTQVRATRVARAAATGAGQLGLTCCSPHASCVKRYVQMAFFNDGSMQMSS